MHFPGYLDSFSDFRWSKGGSGGVTDNQPSESSCVHQLTGVYFTAQFPPLPLIRGISSAGAAQWWAFCWSDNKTQRLKWNSQSVDKCQVCLICSNIKSLYVLITAWDWALKRTNYLNGTFSVWAGQSVNCVFNWSHNVIMLTFPKSQISASISICERSWQFNRIKRNRAVLQCQSPSPVSSHPCHSFNPLTLSLSFKLHLQNKLLKADN